MIDATFVAPPYVEATTAVFASPSKTLPVDELAVNSAEFAKTTVDGGIVIVVFDAELKRPCASTVKTGIAVEPPYVPAEIPVVVKSPDGIVLAAILSPVIVASTILLALIDVKPSLSPVTAPAAILADVTEPSDGTNAAEPLPICRTTTLFVPLAGAETNDITSAIREYVVGG
jgi:sorbitol-specific phosphotransferase system component IIBC